MELDEESKNNNKINHVIIIQFSLNNPPDEKGKNWQLSCTIIYLLSESAVGDTKKFSLLKNFSRSADLR